MVVGETVAGCDDVCVSGTILVEESGAIGVCCAATPASRRSNDNVRIIFAPKTKLLTVALFFFFLHVSLSISML